jgi:hypothetical protein
VSSTAPRGRQDLHRSRLLKMCRKSRAASLTRCQ